MQHVTRHHDGKRMMQLKTMSTPKPKRSFATYSNYALLFSAFAFVYVQLTTLFRLENHQSEAVIPQQSLQLSLPLVQSMYYKDHTDDNKEETRCQPSHPWQRQSFLVCNTLHEVETSFDTTLNFINCGGSRCAFRLLDDFGGDYVVMKTIKYSSDFVAIRYDKARIDALTMERLTSSPYVANIYGNCGTSQLVETAEQNLHDLFKRKRKGSTVLTSMQKLKIAFQLSSAVADLHSFDGATPSMAHMDICCHQFILVQGVYKLNDFHLSTFLELDTFQNFTATSTVMCPVKTVWSEFLAKLHAPEEQQKTNGDWPDVFNAPAVDVYMLGNVLYTLMTSSWVFEGMATEDAVAAMRKRSRPFMPTQMNDPIISVLRHVILECWKDVNARPTSKDINIYLKEHLSQLEGGEILTTPVTVVIPPLPSDHRYTDNDFNSNLV
jgi:hypothetical protein